MKDESVGQEYEQKGFITFGGGIDEHYWMDEAAAQGYIVVPKANHAELYLVAKKS